MPQISRFPLKPKIAKEITNSLWWVVANLRTEDEVSKFLGDLLTTTEKTMLAKRLAVALMLEKGFTYWQIRDTLKVSTATILAMRNWLEKGGEGYRLAIRKLLRREKIKNFLQESRIG